MPSCQNCRTEIPGEARFCPGCGHPASGLSALPTLGHPSSPAPSPLPGLGRFLPGQVLGGRYRIAGLLGRGGMGEVFRADDLKLGLPVALKLLPEDLERDPERLALLQHEVRLSLRVTHPHVCRVHDLGEADGHHFISMELVDGEDLASLLGRVGRLPRDRALQVARQLCSGLAAIHKQGIVHRDLKPANVLVDGRGTARITDFGLAGIAAGTGLRTRPAGTPAYMAPEQLAGEPASVRSDIYGLGLVLYEMFTGRAAFSGNSVTGLRQRHRSSPPPGPSSLVEGLDPVVERVIMGCLEEIPEDRPSSALQVAGSLPGGDPLAAALAAGEVPSPALVAAMGRHAGLTPSVALGLGCLVILGTLASVALAGRSQATQVVPLPRPPAVLESEGEELLRSVGLTGSLADRASGFEMDLPALQRWDSTAGRREDDGGPPPAPPDIPIRFWYRVSPQPLVPLQQRRHWADPGDPPTDQPGMALLRMDSLGRLLSLQLIPPAGEEPLSRQGPPDWSPLLRAAGIDPAASRPIPPRHAPATAADTLAAWEVVVPGGGASLVVEATALGPQPVSFHLDGPARPTTRGGLSLAWAQEGVLVTWYLAALVLGAILARRNLRLGHGDRRGALRLALAVLGAQLLSWLFSAHHVADPRELDLFIEATAWAVYSAVLLWLLYMAVEPLFRSFWPRQMTSWVRLLGGRLRDPLVGRDLLIGLLIGLALSLNTDLYHLVPRWLGFSAPGLDGLTQLDGEMRALSGGRHLVGLLLDKLTLSLRNTFIGVTLLVLLRVATRRALIAVGLWLAMGTLLFNPMAGPPGWDLAVALLQVSLFTLALLQFGFLTAAVATAVLYVQLSFPLTLQWSAWYADGALLTLGLLLAATLWGMLSAVGDRRWLEPVLQATRHPQT